MEELDLANNTSQTEKVTVEEVLRESLRRQVSLLSLDSTSNDTNENEEKKTSDNKDEKKSSESDDTDKKKPNDVARRISLSYKKLRKSISELEIDMSDDDDSDTGDSTVADEDTTNEDTNDADGKRSYDVNDDRKELPNNVAARRISLSYQRLRKSIDKFEDELANVKMGSNDELSDS